jgi:hypothetical protein
VAGAKTLEQANTYLEAEFIDGGTHAVVPPAATMRTAHRQGYLAGGLAELCGTRQVSNDYTIR